MADEAGTWTTGAGAIKKDPKKDYEVFLNFRGPDSRFTVVDVLYHALDDAGFGVFYDAPEIRHGEVIAEELVKGIKKSNIYIPIFSPGYASSKWCLRELRLIIECWEGQKEQKVILPIFCDVDVSKDLKFKEGSLYDAALKDEKMEPYSDEFEGWKQALKTVAEIEGKDINLLGLTKLTELMVEDVCRKIGITSYPEWALDDYVGIRERRKEIMDRLKLDDSDCVRVVIVYGIAGMGKTALARLVFEELKLSSDFQGRAAFLSISDGTADIVSLQKDLVSQLLKVNASDLTYAELGVEWIKAKLEKKKVLIVLDGLHNEDQLLKLAGETSWFGKGSRVIITTRDISIIKLIKGGGCYEYKMPEMKYDDALKLLCRKAFNSDSPPEETDKKILQDLLKGASGNPKAICDIGSELGRRNENEWEGTIKEFEQVPPKNFKEQFKIVYNKLESRSQREIFLDIACLFIDVEKNDASHYWEAQHYCNNLRTDLVTLKNHSLIEIVDGNKLGMSHLLRSLGRYIVDDTANSPGMRSRLWSPEVALKLVSEKKGTDQVVAINLGEDVGQHNFDPEQFQGLKQLKFLHLNGGYFKTEDFKNIFSELRWLSWDACPLEFRAIKLCFQNLLILMLSNTKICGKWNGWYEIKEAKNLKVLKCTDCYSLKKSPDFSAFPQLERLIFKNCPKLKKIDQSVGCLEKLKHLCLWCPKLEELPESVGNLTSLVELDVSHTRFTTLPESVMDLIRSLKVVFKHENCGLNEEVLDKIKKLRPRM